MPYLEKTENHNQTTFKSALIIVSTYHRVRSNASLSNLKKVVFRLQTDQKMHLD